MFGLEIGAVSVKLVKKNNSSSFESFIEHHEGNPGEKVREIFTRQNINIDSKIVITGNAAKTLIDKPYRPETECIEAALDFHKSKPTMLLSLGGENFFLYTLRNGFVKNIIGSSKCAAGTGEFIVQQLQRLDLNLKQGIELSYCGNFVSLASRCSVYCKSDATHKLNKGECSKADIVKSLIENLVKKVVGMIESVQWSPGTIVIAGGLTLNSQFMEILVRYLPASEIISFKESPYIEAFGASLIASGLKDSDWKQNRGTSLYKVPMPLTSNLSSLSHGESLLDYRVKTKRDHPLTSEPYLLGIDAGSTTTKAVLFNMVRGTIAAECYLKTHGNPVEAAKKCIERIMEKVDTSSLSILRIGVTGSGRELVSLFFNNCLHFNEIIAHAKASSVEVPDVDTVFEIGGQDSKFISFLNGIPIDYAMNEGCSAGTGSFLEEAVSVDMKVPVEEISTHAIKSKQPIEFGERCAAFINSDLRNALQEGAGREDIIAGLTYSIAKNYISRIVGVRHIGKTIIFQGGVALNRAVALSLALIINKKIIVPSYPELMGCIGVCLLLKEMLENMEIEKENISLVEFIRGETIDRGTFRCASCENNCEIQKIEIHNKIQPFGGLCSKYELFRRKIKDNKKGIDFISLRNTLMFKKYSPRQDIKSDKTVGIPLALSMYEFFPFYSKLINELGYNIVISEFSKKGNSLVKNPICYPCEIMHGAVYDLLQKNVDYILLPQIYEGNEIDAQNYFCPPAININALLKSAFKPFSSRLLILHSGMNKKESRLTKNSIIELGKKLGVNKKNSLKAYKSALHYYNTFKKEYLEISNNRIKEIVSNPTIILIGKPYVLYDSNVNFGLPQKIISRGYNVVPADILPRVENKNQNKYNIWYYSRQMMNAIEMAKKNKNIYICLISCFSCIPDAAMYHYIRDELAGTTFCYLEIDAHTAYAGFETRLGAFLDIIKQQEKYKLYQKTTHKNKEIGYACEKN